jgi:hypothetical protein
VRQPAGKPLKASDLKWPEQPKFDHPQTERRRKQWCTWTIGGKMVRCRGGEGGAYDEDATDTGPIWGKAEENKHTMVGSGVWTLPS